MNNSLNHQDEDGNTPLMIALYENNLDVAYRLLQAGADPNIPNNEQETPLLQAINKEDIRLVVAMLEAGGDPRVTNPDGLSALMLISRYGVNQIIPSDNDDVRLVPALLRYLIRIGADANYQDPGGNTVLHHTINNEMSHLAQLFLNEGSDPNIQNNEGETPLMLAVARDDVGIVLELLLRGANPNLQDTNGQTALMRAIYQSEDIVFLLLEAGANPNIQDAEGDTALMVAVSVGNNSMATKLLQAGADPNLRNLQGEVPLTYASEDVVMELIVGMSELPAELQEDYGALYESIHASRGRTIDYLLEGQDPNLSEPRLRGSILRFLR
jgi:ankyrin repeat protein